MNKLCTLLLASLIVAAPSYAKPDKDSDLESAIRDELSYENNQGKGRPDNPGEHGRENAAQKQRENPGKGSKGGDSWEDSSDKDKDKDKDKGKDKDKDKEKEKEKEKNKQKSKNK